MELKDSIEALAALAHPGRMAVFRLLVRRHPDGVQPSEIADSLQMRRNTLSTHLTTMKRAGLLTTERDGRAVFCRIDVAAVGDLIHYMTADCCRGRPDLCAALQFDEIGKGALSAAESRPLNVLFVCTRNSARSIFAEAILARKGGKAFRAFSAGTQPRSGVSPPAIDVLRQKNHAIESLRPKHIDFFRSDSAPKLDFVFTVCDRAANEDCPSWPGRVLTAHWGIPDPVAGGTSRDREIVTYGEAYDMVEERVSAFLALPLRTLDRRSLQRELDNIGRLEAVRSTRQTLEGSG